jgi:hypothetical protein
MAETTVATLAAEWAEPTDATSADETAATMAATKDDP